MSVTFNPFTLEGKTILITGASSGIGRATAIACSKMGATLLLNGRNEVRLKDTYSQLCGTNHKIIQGDITDESILKNIITTITKLDGILLAAGIVKMLPVLFADKNKFESIYTTNLFAPIELLRTIVKKKLYNPGFSAVAISSIAGSEDFCVGNGIYGSGKAALKSFLKYFARETASKGIRINTISPGLILTPMQTEGVVGSNELEEAVKSIPMKRWGAPEDVANAAIYLLSDASSYVTGTNIVIDGGYTIR